MSSTCNENNNNAKNSKFIDLIKFLKFIDKKKSSRNFYSNHGAMQDRAMNYG